MPAHVPVTTQRTPIVNRNHWAIDGYHQRMTTKEWKTVLLAGDETLFYRGNMAKLKADRIGPGVYDVYKDIPANKEGQHRE